MQIVHVEFTKDDFELFMREDDAKEFIQGFPEGSFRLTPIHITSFDVACSAWNTFVGDLYDIEED